MRGRELRGSVVALLLLAALVACGSSGAVLSVSKGTLQLSSADNVGSFTLRNAGVADSVLTWSVRADSPLVLVTPASGRLRAGDRAQGVQVRVDQGQLGRGDVLEAALTVTSNGGAATVALRFEMLVDGLAACGTYPRDNWFGHHAPAPASASARAAGASYAPGQLLVQFRDEGLALQSANAQDALLAALARDVAADYGLALQKRATPERPALVTLSGEDPLAAAARLSADPRVLYAEPNYYLEPLALPNDPLLTDQWHLLEFGLPEAWAVETGASSPVVLAVIDSGVDINHADLRSKMLPGCDFGGGDNDPSPGSARSEAAHGTHVAGIAAAAGDNGLGVAGVAYGPQVRILPVKVFDDTGTVGTVDGLLDAMLWSAGLPVAGVGENPNPARIVNMSLGVDPSDLSAAKLRSVDEVARRLLERGVLMFAASGNRGLTDRILAPASSPHVYAVGSVNADLRRSSFSNYAATGVTVDFMAPGGGGSQRACSFSFGVLSTYPDDGYTCLEGTSMAAPFVAGAAALLLSQNPALTPEQVAARLAETAFYDPAFMTPEAYGSGVVCADRALGASTRCGR